MTVNIYINGVLEWTDTRSISGEGAFEAFATIDGATGRVRSL